MNKIILTLLLTTVFAVPANAQNCVNSSRCDELGYDKSIDDCKGYSTLICPFDKNRVFCSTSAGIAQVSDCTGLKAAVTNAGTTIYITNNISSCPLNTIADYVTIIGEGEAKGIYIGTPTAGKNVTFENLIFGGTVTGSSLKLINLSALDSSTQKALFTVTGRMQIENCNLPVTNIDGSGSADLTIKGENKLSNIINVKNINQTEGSLELSSIKKIGKGNFAGILKATYLNGIDLTSEITINSDYSASASGYSSILMSNGTFILNGNTTLSRSCQNVGACGAVSNAKIIANKKLSISSYDLDGIEIICNNETFINIRNFYNSAPSSCYNCKFTVNSQLIYKKEKPSSFSDTSSIKSSEITIAANGKFYTNDTIGRNSNSTSINYAAGAQIGFTDMDSYNGLWQATASGSYTTNVNTSFVMPPEFTKISETSPLP